MVEARKFDGAVGRSRLGSGKIMHKLLGALAGAALVVVVGSPPALAAPTDNFPGTTLSNVLPVTDSGSNVGATKETGEPNHAGKPGGKSVWWNFTPTGSGTFQISTSGSNFDTTLAVYTGSAVNALTEVGSNDDFGGTQSRVLFAGTAGTSYKIAVDGFNGSSGNIGLSVSFVPPPANDNFGSPQDLGTTTPASSSLVSTDGATKQAGEPNHAGNAGGASAWYTWTPSSNTPVRVSTTGSNFDTTLAVYTGPAVNALAEVASNDNGPAGSTSEVIFQAAAGTHYRIAVDGVKANGARVATGNAGVSIDLAPAPSNNDFANRKALNSGDVLNTEHNLPATAQPGEPAHGGAAAAQSVWYVYVAPAASNMADLSVTGDGFAPRVGVYTGTAVNALTSLVQSNQFADFVPDPRRTELYFPTTPGAQYMVAVDGDPGGDFSIAARGLQAAANDSFAAAMALTGNPATSDGDTRAGTAEPNEPQHAARGAHTSLWYTWTAPSDGATTLTTTGSSSDTRLAVYAGATLASLAPVASNDDVSGGDLTSAVSFGSTAGATYRIAVDSGLAGPGAFHLALVHTPDAPTVPVTSDTTPPDTVITKAPTKVTTKHKSAGVSVEFQSTEADSTFACSVDNGPFAPCSSPDSLSLKKGKHTFQVRATDVAGNTDPTPASATIKVKAKKKKHHHHHHHHAR
jgi:hypothetical protein